MGEASAHAKLSPSSAKRWLACTPSAHFESQFPNVETVFAAEGTLAHAVAQEILEFRLGLQTEESYIDNLIKHQSHKLYADEMLTHAEQYADFCLYDAEEGDVCAVETRLDITEFVPEGFGTGDFMRVHIERKVLKFKDLKYGKGVAVSAIDNEQLKIYALGALAWWGWVYDIETVEVSIYQPRINNNSTWSISVVDLVNWAETVVRPKAKLAFVGEGEFVVGDHCKFCRARVRCQALADHNLDLFKHELKSSEELSDESLIEIVKRGSLLAAWYKDIEEYVLSEAVKGKHWEGFKLVEGKSNRVFVSASATEAKLLEEGFTDIYTPEVLLGITALKKSIGAKAFKAFVEPDLRKPAGKPTLVGVDDPRPAFDDALSVFKDAEISAEIGEEGDDD